MRSTVERELKLVPGEGFDLANIGELLPPRAFDTTYHDTRDLRLARHSITLRRRTENGTGLWQLKIPNGAARIELEVAGPSESAPSELTGLLVVHLRDRELAKVARMRTKRRTVIAGGAEIVEDAVSVYDGRRVVKRFRELEVELLDGDERSLRRLELRLLEAGAQPAEFTPKLFRALDFSPDPGPPALAADATPGEALGHALVAQHRRLVGHDPGTRLGNAEDLHQMRVATRRARAFLRAARDLVDPEWTEGLRTELGWLGSLLGPARDADVLHGHLAAALAALGEEAAAHGTPLVRALERERRRARRSAVTALSRKRYFALLDRLEQAERPPLAGKADVRLADLWWDELGRTRKAFRSLDKNSRDEELHEARIRVKRARYSAELAAHELGPAGAPFVSAARKLQDILGEHQDAVVAEAWLTRFGDESPESKELVRLLVEREQKRRRKARRAWPEAWDRLLRRARRARR
jgi:CHAD domain-containing protein